MTSAVRPTRDPQELLQDQAEGIAAWGRHLEGVLSEAGLRGGRRRHLAFVRRANAAVEACLRRRANGLGPPVDRPRAVVATCDDAVRRVIVAALDEVGIAVLGEGSDGAIAVGMTVVEQPEVLVVESGLASGSVAEVARAAQTAAPRTLVVIQTDDLADVQDLPRLDAIALFSRSVPAQELCAEVARLLAET